MNTNGVTFKTELEMLQYCNKNRLIIKISTPIEHYIFTEIYNRNIGELKFEFANKNVKRYIRLFEYSEPNICKYYGFVSNDYDFYEKMGYKYIEIEDLYWMLE